MPIKKVDDKSLNHTTGLMNKHIFFPAEKPVAAFDVIGSNCKPTSYEKTSFDAEPVFASHLLDKSTELPSILLDENVQESNTAIGTSFDNQVDSKLIIIWFVWK